MIQCNYSLNLIIDLMRKKGKGKPNKGSCPKAEAVRKVVLEKYSCKTLSNVVFS